MNTSVSPSQLEQLLGQLIGANQQSTQVTGGGGTAQGALQQQLLQSYLSGTARSSNLLQLLGLLGIQGVNLQQCLPATTNGQAQPAQTLSARAVTSSRGTAKAPAPNTVPSLDSSNRSSKAQAQAQAQAQERTRKPPEGTKMIPCRARRMPLEHNFLVRQFAVAGGPEMYTIVHG
jgi:hypothetical protein